MTIEDPNPAPAPDARQGSLEPDAAAPPANADETRMAEIEKELETLAPDKIAVLERGSQRKAAAERRAALSQEKSMLQLKPVLEAGEREGEESQEQQPPAKEITVSNVGAEHRAEAEQYAVDLGAIAADVGIPVEEAQAVFDFALDLALTGTPGLNLDNPGECLQSLNTRYGENAKAVVADARAAVRRLGQDVASYLNVTGAGNDPGTLLALAEFHRGTTKLSKADAQKELTKIRASKEFHKGERYAVDRGRLLSALAYRGDRNEVTMARAVPKHKTVAQGAREKLESEVQEIRHDPNYYSGDAKLRKVLVARMGELMQQLHPEG